MSEQDFYQEFEVFSRKNPRSGLMHQFSLLAPNEEMAMILAQENFMRREEVMDIWVVPSSSIRHMTDEEREALTQRIDNKNYRTTKAYGYLRKKWQDKEQGMLDEQEIMSWKEVKKNRG
ncbi:MULTISPECIES: 1,2-phenylacetyl-CoA epoxidase subunit PaaB [Geomicrobium]|uniref:Ring-1,2-phenylacetyl-CoA epoxidase subunit PaaB n=1 Tax=Geomicrobium sediminis TaxID=1347788 RepID=A0ABS2P8S9_9BACL|nr:MULTISPECIES: 1,2-phenylacetyl-CoA epoxidase subunit PaaB [Geomicrobium]MBM7631709.1 ring-1,2-phenylacetyl-CoA epoxidase subunit PaaB [Geomicrobium sediminis]GAJ99176.1 phenylacetic acid degradation B [Geomicrobium sp. JCM 19055]GAK09934.1 phenylacetic acid degradation B [Geomicrobium sp. JCM 19038]